MLTRRAGSRANVVCYAGGALLLACSRAPSEAGSDRAAAGASTLSAAPGGPSVFVCSNTRKEAQTERLALPDGRAFVLARTGEAWVTTRAARLDEAARRELEVAFERQGFFAFPERLTSEETDGRTWDLEVASATRAHRSFNYENEHAGYHELFATCERVFASLPTQAANEAAVRESYRALDAFADGLGPNDARRGLLERWLAARDRLLPAGHGGAPGPPLP